jgi:hypothetical protein
MKKPPTNHAVPGQDVEEYQSFGQSAERRRNVPQKNYWCEARIRRTVTAHTADNAFAVVCTHEGQVIMRETVGSPRSTTMPTAGRLLVGIAAVVLVGTGLWAMLSPESFYAAIATFPPFNRHFIHDIGAFQLGLAASLVLALIISDAFLVALGGNAVAAIAHFVSHVIDRELGGQPNDPLTIGLFALVLLALTAWRARTLSQALA